MIKKSKGHNLYGTQVYFLKIRQGAQLVLKLLKGCIFYMAAWKSFKFCFGVQWIVLYNIFSLTCIDKFTALKLFESMSSKMYKNR